jgi:cysteine desulfurase
MGRGRGQGAPGSVADVDPPQPPAGFLDAASGQPLNPAAREAWLAAGDAGWADPARLYREGRRAALLRDSAREAVADRLGARPDEVRLVADGCLPMVIREWLGRVPGHLVCSAVEHSSVLAEADAVRARGGRADIVGVDRYARINPDFYVQALPGASLAVLQAANHEVGTRQPVAEVATACAEARVPLLVDATVTIGREDPPEGWSLLVGRAASWGGPAGVGVIAVRRNLHAPPLPLPDAGLPAALAAARGLEWADDHRRDDALRARALTERIRVQVAAQVPDVAMLGGDDRVDYLTAFSCLFVDGEALVHALDRDGYAISSGSSCVSDLRRPSHVLAAMGALTQGNVRISLPFGVSESTVDGFIAALPDVIGSIRAMLHADDLGPREEQG